MKTISSLIQFVGDITLSLSLLFMQDTSVLGKVSQSVSWDQLMEKYNRQAIVHSENRVGNQRAEGKGSGLILYLGYRLDKSQTAPAPSRNRWSFDEMESDLEDTDNEDDIEVREEIETRGLAGKVSLLCEVS